MHEAAVQAGPSATLRECYAAELRAIAHEMQLGDRPQAHDFPSLPGFAEAVGRWEARLEIRNWLLVEADKAEVWR
jgi:hypothetical protein